MHFYEIKFLRFSFFFCYRIFRGEQRYSLQHVSTIRLLITNIFLNVFTIKIDKCTVRAHYYIVKIGLSVFFIAQRYVSAVYAVVVCPSVCLSQAGTVPQRLNADLQK